MELESTIYKHLVSFYDNSVRYKTISTNVVSEGNYEVQKPESENTIFTPWYIPKCSIPKPSPKLVDRFILNKIIYVVHPDEKCCDVFFNLIKQGIRIFIVQLNYGSLHFNQKKVNMIRQATFCYQTNHDSNIEITIGYKMLNGATIVGRLKDNIPILIHNNEKIYITCDRSYSYNSTKSNLFVNCYEYLNMMENEKKKKQVIIIGHIVLEVIKFGKKSISCVAKLKSATETLHSYDQCIFPVVIHRAPTLEEALDIKFILENCGDFILTPRVHDAYYYEKLRTIMEFFGLTYIPIVGKFALNELKNMENLFENSYEMFLIDNYSQPNDIVDICRQINKPILIQFSSIISANSCEANKFIPLILHEIDCILISSSEQIKCVLSIEAIDDKNLKRNAEMKIASIEDCRAADILINCIFITSFLTQTNLIICLTKSGQTAFNLSRQKPMCPILAVSTSKETVRRVSLWRGVLGLFWSKSINRHWESEVEKILHFGMMFSLNKKYITRNNTILYIYNSNVNTGYANNYRLIKI